MIYMDFPFVDAKHFGRLKSGALICYPYALSYKNSEDITITQLGPVKIDPDTEEADDLAVTYILSDKAKKFVMAREMLLSRSYDYYVKGFLIGLGGAAGYGVGRFMKLYHRI